MPCPACCNFAVNASFSACEITCLCKGLVLGGYPNFMGACGWSPGVVLGASWDMRLRLIGLGWVLLTLVGGVFILRISCLLADIRAALRMGDSKLPLSRFACRLADIHAVFLYLRSSSSGVILSDKPPEIPPCSSNPIKPSSEDSCVFEILANFESIFT